MTSTRRRQAAAATTASPIPERPRSPAVAGNRVTRIQQGRKILAPSNPPGRLPPPVLQTRADWNQCLSPPVPLLVLGRLNVVVPFVFPFRSFLPPSMPNSLQLPLFFFHRENKTSRPPWISHRSSIHTGSPSSTFADFVPCLPVIVGAAKSHTAAGLLPVEERRTKPLPRATPLPPFLCFVCFQRDHEVCPQPQAHRPPAGELH
ncbi:uncharacterized protein [Triticum aestivum]|uniref:uncharacterized protein n=1 Tax=Triticum aestivum TaxID=4565 RepID=UPI001D001F9D|nr:uncharacterized protein LOC123152506 [Triticum aestivum]